MRITKLILKFSPSYHPPPPPPKKDPRKILCAYCLTLCVALEYLFLIVVITDFRLSYVGMYLLIVLIIIGGGGGERGVIFFLCFFDKETL
jgi:hypothetical protein